MSNRFSLYALGTCRLCGGTRNHHLAGCDGELLDALGWGLLRAGTTEDPLVHHDGGGNVEWNWHAFEVGVDRAALLAEAANAEELGDSHALYRVLVLPPEDVHDEVAALHAPVADARAAATATAEWREAIERKVGLLRSTARMLRRYRTLLGLSPDVRDEEQMRAAIPRMEAELATGRADLEALRGKVSDDDLDAWLASI